MDPNVTEQEIDQALFPESVKEDVEPSEPEQSEQSEQSEEAPQETVQPDDYSDVAFHKHPRFQQLIKEKNDYKQRISELEAKLDGLTPEQIEYARKISKQQMERELAIRNKVNEVGLNKVLESIPDKDTQAAVGVIINDLARQLNHYQEQERKRYDDMVQKDLASIKERMPGITEQQQTAVITFALNNEVTIPEAFDALFGNISVSNSRETPVFDSTKSGGRPAREPAINFDQYSDPEIAKDLWNTLKKG